ncbi:hypothetical protein BVRB_6g140470 [Beta vulgaris subsp. vulgaris]|nr:hypothetical protein BVRB_6g140470 [Beta vulgaris subsp. vulgaris]
MFVGVLLFADGRQLSGCSCSWPVVLRTPVVGACILAAARSPSVLCFVPAQVEQRPLSWRTWM